MDMATTRIRSGGGWLRRVLAVLTSVAMALSTLPAPALAEAVVELGDDQWEAPADTEEVVAQDQGDGSGSTRPRYQCYVKCEDRSSLDAELALLHDVALERARKWTETSEEVQAELAESHEVAVIYRHYELGNGYVGYRYLRVTPHTTEDKYIDKGSDLESKYVVYYSKLGDEVPLSFAKITNENSLPARIARMDECTLEEASAWALGSEEFAAERAKGKTVMVYARGQNGEFSCIVFEPGSDEQSVGSYTYNWLKQSVADNNAVFCPEGYDPYADIIYDTNVVASSTSCTVENSSVSSSNRPVYTVDRGVKVKFSLYIDNAHIYLNGEEVAIENADYGGRYYWLAGADAAINWENYSSSHSIYLTDVRHSVTLDGGANAKSSGGETVQSDLPVEMTTVTYTPNRGYFFEEFEAYETDGVRVEYVNGSKVTVSGTPTQDATVTVPDAVVLPVNFMKEGEELTRADPYVVLEDTDTDWPADWYVAEGEVSITSRIVVHGEVNLILKDGANLKACQGINVASGSTLNVYAQAGGSGSLVAGDMIEKYDDGKHAGIGGSSGNDGGDICVYGGHVTSYGGEGAAHIGGGAGGAGGTFTIYDGSVTVERTMFVESAAAIGGGNNAAGGTVNIKGGTVTVEGGKYAAGIGGGAGGAGGTVTISGGTVNAQGGRGDGVRGGGAAIGGGAGGAGGTVIIEGGTVNADGGEYAAGIGGGHYGRGGDVTITGGNVVAEGTVGIGAGLGAATEEYIPGLTPGIDTGHGTLTVGPGLFVYGGEDENNMRYMENELFSYKRYGRMEVNDTAPETYTVTLTGGANATRNGFMKQTGITYSMRDILFTPKDGCWFEPFETYTVDGIMVSYRGDGTIHVGGQPTTKNVVVPIPDAVWDGETPLEEGPTFVRVQSPETMASELKGAFYGYSPDYMYECIESDEFNAALAEDGVSAAVVVFRYDSSSGRGIAMGMRKDGQILELSVTVESLADGYAVFYAKGDSQGGQDEPEEPKPTSYSYCYYDESGVRHTDGICTEFEEVETEFPVWYKNRWYVVSGNVTIPSRAGVNGSANLILCDGATLTVEQGIQLLGNCTLNIYTQSAGTGKLICGGLNTTAGSAGIGGENENYADRYNAGTLNIHGGTITVTSTGGAAAIGGGVGGAGGAVTIYGGTVTAIGSNGAVGIGAGLDGSDNGTLTIGEGLPVYGGADEASAVEQAGYDGTTRFAYMKVGETGESATVTLSAVTSDEIGTSVGHIAIEPVGELSPGDEVALTAPTVPGYEFLGWFNGSERVCETLAYSFTITRDTGLMASYKARGNAIVTISCSNGAKFTVDGGSTSQSGYKREMRLGTTHVFTAVDPDKVLQWQNDNGKVMSRDAALELTITGNTIVTLVYKGEESDSQAYVQFVSDYGQVIAAQNYGMEDEIGYPDTQPSKFGYTFEKWVIDGTETEATEEALKALFATEDTITVKPKYKKNAEAYDVTVKYEGADKDDDVFSDITIGTGYTVVAPEIDGKVFQCWRIGDDTVGYNRSYYFQVAGDITLTAVYGDAEVAAVPTITMGQLGTVESGSTHKVTGIATRSVPDGYELVEHGILYARDFGDPNEANFTYGAEGVGKYVSTDAVASGVVRLNVKVANDDVVVTLRGYMILREVATGNEVIYYSNIASGSYAELVA